ncbi:hypothetical protein [Hyalangium minutum]|uniref:Uncharacterized protein n=1 Tax=Hyalangium minutum TaxID=394096 RepID=A0A085W475_9BACT|nr:hypothetical protein [Hyalangium minutum]KFE62488.1 hypothetical protein DB31_3922 [Hyalangium minutum]
MPRLGAASFKSTPSFTSSLRPSASTSTPRTSSPPRSPSPSAPQSPSRRDSFETRSPKQETAPKSPTQQEGGDGWETVSSKKKPRVQGSADPDRQFKQSLQQVHNSLDASVSRMSQREYGEVKVPRNGLKRLHEELTKQYHRQEIPGTNGREQYYVTRQDFFKKGGGFNITAHDVSRNGKDISKQNERTSWLNLHVVP